MGNHRAVHSSFLSTEDGNLDVSADLRGDGAIPEIVPRAFNRLLFLAPKLPFQVITPGQYANKPFSMKTAILLVIVLRK